MSPTSYQAAPPRFMTIADAPHQVKLGAHSDDTPPLFN
jgi:hypothetical protein